MDGTDVCRLPCRDRTDTHTPDKRGSAMNTSRRFLLAGMAGLALVPAAGVAAPAPAIDGATVAEERFARTIAAAHAPGVTCAHQAERYADLHWRDYVGAARAVLD